MAAASAGDTIFLRDSVTENVTITPGVNIAAWQGSSANTPTITGKLTMTGAGVSTISGIHLKTNSDYFLSVTGSAASQLLISNCYLDCSNNTGIQYTSSSSSSGITFYNCGGNLGTTGIGLYTHSAAGSMSFAQCQISNSGASTTASSNSAGSVGFGGSGIFVPMACSGGTINLNGSFINTQATNTVGLAMTGTGQAYLYMSSVATGTASTITVDTSAVVNIYNQCVLQSTNAATVSGAGTFQYGEFMTDSASSTTVTAATQTPLPVIGGGWSLIKTLTASSSASLAFTTLPVYPVYAVVFSNLTPATNAQDLEFLASSNNGTSYATSGYSSGVNYSAYNSATITNATATTYGVMAHSQSNGIGLYGTVFFTPSNGGWWGQMSFYNTTLNTYTIGFVTGNSGIVFNALKFQFASGNIASGSITIYGLKTGN
jgi:hypothetical protein